MELDTMFNRQVLESSRAFIYGGSVGALAGFILSFKYKSPTVVSGSKTDRAALGRHRLLHVQPAQVRALVLVDLPAVGTARQAGPRRLR